MLRFELALCAIGCRVEHAATSQELPVTLEAGDTRRLEERSDTRGARFNDSGLALLHRRHIETEVADLDAVRGEFALCAMVELGRLQQGLGWNAARIEAGAAEGEGAVAIFPLVDARHLELVLSGANGRWIARGTSANHDHIECVHHVTSCFRYLPACAPDPRGIP